MKVLNRCLCLLGRLDQEAGPGELLSVTGRVSSAPLLKPLLSPQLP